MIYLIVFVTIIPIMIITLVMPYITRKTESFGVSIPEEIYNCRELVVMRKKYVVQLGIVSAGMLLFQLISIYFGGVAWINKSFLILIPCYLIISFMLYLSFHKQMKKLKEERKWGESKKQTIAINTKFHSQKKVYSNGWFIIPLAISIGTIILTSIFFDKIPNKIPMKYDFEGNVTNWSNKSYWSVYQLPFIQLFLSGLFLYMNQAISKSKQQINAANPEKSMQQNVIFRKRWSLFLIITSILITILFFLIQLSFIIDMNQAILQGVSLGLVAFIILMAIIISIVTGQGGSRVKITKKENNMMVNYNDDQYWKLGVFYYNRNDPSIWVEKRFGSGWTMNFARPLGWIIILIILFIPIIIAWFS